MLIIILILLLIFLSLKLRSKVKQCDLPGPKPYPVLGNALEFFTALSFASCSRPRNLESLTFTTSWRNIQFLKELQCGNMYFPLNRKISYCARPGYEDPLFIMQRLKNKYNTICRLWLGLDLYVFLGDPKDIEVILSSYNHILKAKAYEYIKPWLGEGLITSHGETWATHRKFLTPTFHFKILENSLEIIHKNAQILVQQLKPKLDEKEFDVYIFLEKMSLDVISEVAMDVQINSQLSTDESYLHAVRSATEISVGRIFKVWLQPDILFRWSPRYNEYQKSLRIIEKVAQDVIKSKRKKIENDDSHSIVADTLKDNSESVEINSINSSKKTRTPFLNSMLMESNFTDQEIYDEVMSFMFAGHDTTTTGISFCVHQISRYQDIQEKLYQEIMSVIPYTDVPKIQDLTKLKYTETVIKETFRLYPPVPMIGRTLLEDVVLPSGYKIPANSNVTIFIYDMHRDPTIFPEPEKFIPERFENDQRHPFCYIPFSAGPRNCLGQKLAMIEIKITLVNILKNYKLLPAESFKSFDLATGIILRCKNGFPIRVVKREDSKNI